MRGVDSGVNPQFVQRIDWLPTLVAGQTRSPEGERLVWLSVRSRIRRALPRGDAAPGAREEGRQDKRSHDEEKLARREEALLRQLNTAVDRYAEALELFDQWKSQGVRDKAQLSKALKGQSVNDKLKELRRQIEMRTIGCGWTQFKVKWSYDPDEKEVRTSY